MSLHPFSTAVETELREHGWVAHPRGEWNHLAGRANEYGRLRSTILDLADQLDRLSRGGGQYGEIRRRHALEADEQRTCEHTDPLHVYRNRVDDEYGPTRRDEGDR